MPIYEYRCGSCGHYLDALQKISDAPLTDCPECEEAALRRLISAPSFRLKGSGWYETDFKSDQERKRNLAESGTADGGEKADAADKKESGDKAKSTAKSDGEPAKKSETKTGDSSRESTKPAAKAKGSGSEAA
jgi:putative FmdB family regulatory protein